VLSQTRAGRCKKWLKASCVLHESEGKGDLSPFKPYIEACSFDGTSLDYAWTETHSFFVLMGGFMLYVNDEPYHTLSPDNLLKMAQSGCIGVPKLSARQIRDRSKGNMISKGLVILQVTWFVLQLTSRNIYHFETTQLEAGTLAFAVLNFITYAVWWNKPLDVQCPYPVYWTLSGSKPEDSYFDEHVCVLPSCTAEVHCACFSVYPKSAFQLPLLDTIMIPFHQLLGSMVNFTSGKYRVVTFDGSNELDDLSRIIILFAGYGMATVFGGIHCIAWSFAFPTYQEQILWRMCAIGIILVPWLGLLLNIVTAYLGVAHTFESSMVVEVMFIVLVLVARRINGSSPVVVGMFIVLAFMYIIVRAFLLILMVTTLRNLPPGAYKVVSWTRLIPHL
jgi:hypothetical protein